MSHAERHTERHTERDLEILALNQAMLESVMQGDWQAYSAVCCPSISCFEADAKGHLVEGLAFHQFYFPSQPANQEEGSDSAKVTVTMASPHLRWLSDHAVVLSYTRLVQRYSHGEAVTTSCNETRIWQQLDGSWKQVHMHRS